MPKQNSEDKLAEKLKNIHQGEEEKQAKKTAQSLGLPFIDLMILPIQSEALALIDEKTAKIGKIVAIKKEGREIKIALIDPKNETAQNTIENFKTKGFKTSLFITSSRGLNKAFSFYKNLVEEKETTGQIEIDEKSLKEFQDKINNFKDLQNLIDEFARGNAFLILEIIIAGALKNNASDIHLESLEKGSLLRYRVDGILYDAASLEPKIHHFVLSRIKLISDVIINVKDKPQDGRFTIKLNGFDVESRVSIIPAPQGENVVMRILNPASIEMKLSGLGLRPDILELMKKEIRRPNGMIITTGPTGSGKTTTLYSFLKEIANPKVKVITLEDPIEYHLEHVTQTQVEPERGYTFAQGLRSALRQDPDVMLVGEIRDKETAEISLQAALTGHLVFSTLHTNDAAGAIPRMLDLGANPVSLASGLIDVIAQRLVRKLCPECKEKYSPSKEELKKIKEALASLPEEIKPDLDEQKTDLFRPAQNGCPHCNHTGFKGRIGVYEIIQVKDSLERLTSQQPTHAQILDLLKKEGFVSMYQDGMIKVLNGETSLDELESVVGK